MTERRTFATAAEIEYWPRRREWWQMAVAFALMAYYAF